MIPSRDSKGRRLLQNSSKQSIRAFLVVSAVLIAVLSLILYGITRESALLAASGLAGLALSTVYLYYFKRERQ